MQELLYVLKVAAGHGLQEELQEMLVCDVPPTYVRLSTLAPLSNWGYPAGSEGAILAISDAGVVVGVEGEAVAPHAFVPWQNVSYLAESHGLENREEPPETIPE